MKLSCLSSDYLKRAERLRCASDAPTLLYAALELRCGIEARLKEYTAHAVRISKAQAKEWEIKKLGRTLEETYGLGDTMVIIFVQVGNGPVAQFLFAPVPARLQEIGKRLGDYLHAIPSDKAENDSYWQELSLMLHEGCGLLQLACAGEVLRPSFSDGLHFILEPDDPRVQIVRQLQEGIQPEISVMHITPVGPITYYPANEANELSLLRAPHFSGASTSALD